MERRKHARYGLKAPVSFVWKDALAKRHRSRGFTRDISVRGAFVLAKNPPPLGTRVRLKVHFRDRLMLEMRTEGQAIRVHATEADRTEQGFAALTRAWKAYRDSS